MTANEQSPEELEKKITEAEKEAQVENDQIEDTPSPFEGAPPAQTVEVPPEKKELSKGRKFFRSMLVWLVVIALAFAGGFFVDAILRYQPARSQAESLQASLDESQATITALEGEIEHLTTYQDQNAALEEEVAQLTTHLTLLSARVAVADARLALELENQADAKLALDKLGTTLASLKELVNLDQAPVVENMIQRQQLIMLEFDQEGFSALTDLDVLASRLNALENTLFAAP